jgi:hypothetical protein
MIGARRLLIVLWVGFDELAEPIFVSRQRRLEPFFDYPQPGFSIEGLTAFAACARGIPQLACDTWWRRRRT